MNRSLWFVCVLLGLLVAAPTLGREEPRALPRIERYEADTATAITRGPYLQSGTPNSVIVRWRTDSATDSRVLCGFAVGNLTLCGADPAPTVEHIVRVANLTPATRYYYAVGSTEELLAGDDADHYFQTPPVVGSQVSIRAWVLGDSGTGDANAVAVREAYYAFTGSRHTDLWLMLGDNAYTDGTDTQYQANLFDIYDAMLRKSVLWPSFGNHDGYSADSSTQSGPYYDIFSLPTEGEAGGIGSYTEAYYSFDHANVHFVVLDSAESDRSLGSDMLNWLETDLLTTSQDWTIVFWHHAPYTKGSHNSDKENQLIEIRENVVPILDDHGVDLTLTGHSHSYERSFLIDGFYATPTTVPGDGIVLNAGDGREDGDGAYSKSILGPNPRSGTVYAVAGSSGKLGGGSMDHPAMFISLSQLGSVVLDIEGARLDARFINDDGHVADHFSIIKDVTVPACDQDGVCETGEDCIGCSGDCSADPGAVCGNRICEAGDGEDCVSCPQDCAGRQNGKPDRRFCCGDGDGINPLDCGDPACNSGDLECTNIPAETSCCGDGVCGGSETGWNCPVDCGPPPGCGDGVCEAPEDSCSCPVDCGPPESAEDPASTCNDGVDNDCDTLIDCDDQECTDAENCRCVPRGEPCTADEQCCSQKCRGPQSGRTCRQ